MMAMTMSERPILLPPVEVDDFEEFKRFAKDASMITYEPDYLRSPFLDDPPRLKRVTFYAVGILINGLPITMKCVLDYTDLIDRSQSWYDQADDVERALVNLIAEVRADAPFIRGRVDYETPELSGLVNRT